MADYMADDIDGDEDGVSDDELSDEELGKRTRRRRRTVPRQPPVPIPSGPSITGKRVPAGLVPVTLVAASNPVFALQGEPQRAYQAERLILTAVMTVAGVVTDVLFALNVSSIKVGDTEQFTTAGEERIPGEMFRSTAVGAAIDLSTSKAATKLTVRAELPAALVAGLGAGSITISGGFYGRVVGA